MDHQAERCLACDHVLDVGRFCINCGHPKGAPVDPDAARTTAERPAVPSDGEGGTGRPRRPVPPPPAHAPPRPVRYPLFADETAGSAPDRAREGGPTSADDLLPLRPAPDRGDDRKPVVAGVGWVVAALAVVVLFVIGGMLLLNGSDDDPAGVTAGDPEPPAASAPQDPQDPQDPLSSGGPEATPDVAPEATPSADDEQSDDGSDDGSDDSAPVDLSARTEAEPPATAGPSRDVEGNPVTYDAANMLDGRADTAWRMPGDGSGEQVVLRLDSPAAISEVGLINGYAKVDPGYDGYTANRRITRVEWVFGNGTVLTQDLAEGLAVQSIPVSGVVTDTVALRIVAVSRPARGRAGRDYTAISEISLVGSPA